MFKGKKSLYILLPVNLFIWGYMGYKIYAALNENETGLAPEAAAPQPKLEMEDSSAYVLSLDYKDPFLKEDKSTRSYPSPARANVPATVAAARSRPLAPPPVEIKYLGLIENKSSGYKAAVVNVNGSSQVIQPGQTVDAILFQSMTPEFLVVKIGKEMLTIRK